MYLSSKGNLMMHIKSRLFSCNFSIQKLFSFKPILFYTQKDISLSHSLFQICISQNCPSVSFIPRSIFSFITLIPQSGEHQGKPHPSQLDVKFWEQPSSTFPFFSLESTAYCLTLRCPTCSVLTFTPLIRTLTIIKCGHDVLGRLRGFSF